MNYLEENHPLYTFPISVSTNLVLPPPSAGDGVTFVCEVAHPAPYFITWLKDSKPLDDKLADRVQQTDAGAKHALKVYDGNAECVSVIMHSS